MDIYFVRHGLTEGNEANQFQKPTIPLSEKGREQAQFLAKRFETIPIDVIIASSMERAHETAEIISAHVGKNVIKSELFVEILRPSVVRGRSKEDPEVKEIMREVKRNFTNSEWRHSDEENFFLVKDRAIRGLESIKSRSESSILIATHGEILRMLLAVIVFGESLSPEMYEHIKSAFVPFNTGITKVNYDPSLGYNSSGWYVHTWNDHAHLGNVG